MEKPVVITLSCIHNFSDRRIAMGNATYIYCTASTIFLLLLLSDVKSMVEF